MGRIVIPGFRKIETSSGGEGGTTNYNDLTNKPFINNVPLVGNLNTVDLHLTDTTLTEEGVPAEAKTVGQKLEEQSTSLTAVKEELTNKVNVSDIPTKVSELQNDSNYQTDTDVTNTLTTYATKTYVGEQISSADHLKREIVTEIPSPETADKNTIYMLKIESATGEDKYKEYLLIDGTLQCIGDTSVDLTDYAKKTEIPTELPANGGNYSTVNGHTVNTDVPENAVFTDTIYDDTDVKEEINEINSNLGVIGKCKNLLNPTLQTTTQNGVTCTNNGDGTYTVDGTATADVDFKVAGFTLTGTYNILGAPKSEVAGKFYVGGLNVYYAPYSGVVRTYDNTSIEYMIVVTSGTTVNKELVKPMVTTNLSATYDDFVPYTGDGDTLTADVANIKKDLSNYELFKVFLLGAARGLPNVSSVNLNIDISKYKVVSAICYLQNGTIEQLSLKTDGNTIISASCRYGNITEYYIYGIKK